MIRPITTACRKRRIYVYDLEWFPGTLELRLVGMHDGKRYEAFHTVAAFLDRILTPEFDDTWFFAHAGGLADVQFLLQELMDRGYEVKAAFSGSSAIIVEIKRGDHKWLLIDSYWLVRSSLKKIGEAVGIKKMKDYVCPGTNWITAPDGSKVIDCAGCSHPPPEDLADPWCIFYAPYGELRTYNEQDCLILWTAISWLQDGLLQMGSELCMTQASSAMRLYRRSYLDIDIKTHATINERARESYVGSRVEVQAPRCEHAYYYDVNSSFPFAMTFPAPGSLRGGSPRLRTSGDELFLADVEIEVPEMYLPPIPWRHPKEKRVYFPTGRWRSWLMGVDVRLLEASGGKIHKVHRVLEFQAHETLAAYSRDLYERRLKSTTEFEKMLYKLLLNSLYGKFGENPLKTAAYFNPTDTEGLEMLMPGIFAREERMDVEHEHVVVASHITAFARRTLYKFDRMALDAGYKLFYNDTDSIVTTAPPEVFGSAIGKELGQLKWEYEILNGMFVAPKIYLLDAIDVEKRIKMSEKIAERENIRNWRGLGEEERQRFHQEASEKARKEIVRAKGFSRMSVARFHEIVEGREVSVRRMSRVRELLKLGRLQPFESEKKKRLQMRVGPDGAISFKMRPKRCVMHRENDTRPWGVDELLAEPSTKPEAA